MTELYLTAPASGVLREVRGLEAAAASAGCRGAGLYVALGDEVSSDIESNSQYIGYVHAVGETREDSYGKALDAAGHIAYVVDGAR
ncbi:hypothetical protein G3M53_59630 [Streptomyces sp. SID7982]|nr:hypothetical protein [Streptomyces sp. SID7982]